MYCQHLPEPWGSQAALQHWGLVLFCDCEDPGEEPDVSWALRKQEPLANSGPISSSHPELPFIVIPHLLIVLYPMAGSLLLHRLIPVRGTHSFKKVKLPWQCLEPSDFLLHLLEEKGS